MSLAEKQDGIVARLSLIEDMHERLAALMSRAKKILAPDAAQLTEAFDAVFEITHAVSDRDHILRGVGDRQAHAVAGLEFQGDAFLLRADAADLEHRFAEIVADDGAVGGQVASQGEGDVTAAGSEVRHGLGLGGLGGGDELFAPADA